MQKPLVIGATTLTLLFGGAGVANATQPIVPAPETTTIVAQQDNYQNDNDDNTGLWGLAGLLGLLGLAGLIRRKNADYPATRGTTGGPTTPPAPRM